MKPTQYIQFLALGGMLLGAGSAHAQMFQDALVLWGDTEHMVGVSDIQTTTQIDGETVATSYVDAMQMYPAASSAVQVGDTIFNTLNGGSHISLQLRPGGGWLGNPSGPFPTASPSSAAYSAAVSSFGFNNEGEQETLNLTNLVIGATYQVELWDTSGFKAEFSGTNLATLTGNTYIVGTFTAADTNVSITGLDAGSYNTLSDISLRQVAAPEPSTYALILAGFALLFVGLRYKRIAFRS